jgi:hypothetical protein
MVATMNTLTVQKQFSIESDIPYADLHSHACANLELEPAAAELGYWVSGVEGPKFLPSALSSEDDFLHAMTRICTLTLQVWTKEYGIEISNLVSDILSSSLSPFLYVVDVFIPESTAPTS